MRVVISMMAKDIMFYEIDFNTANFELRLNTLRYSMINIKLNTYSQNAVPNELILHLAPFPQGFGLQDEKPEKKRRK